MDYFIYATLFYRKFRTPFERISRNKFLNYLWLYFLHILCFRALLVWSASWYWVKLCYHGHIIRRIFGVLSLRNLRINQFYFFQRVPFINNFVRYHMGFTAGRCRIFVWLFNFFTVFLSRLVVYSFITGKLFFKTICLAIFYFCEKIFYRANFLTYLYLFKNCSEILPQRRPLDLSL